MEIYIFGKIKLYLLHPIAIELHIMADENGAT